jgi:hypothetical protein
VGFFLEIKIPIMKINNVDYDTYQHSDRANAHLIMLTVDDAEIKRLQAQLAIAQTEKNAYAQLLPQALVTIPNCDTFKL